MTGKGVFLPYLEYVEVDRGQTTNQHRSDHLTQRDIIATEQNAVGKTCHSSDAALV